MHYSEFGTQPVHIVRHVRFKTFEIRAIFIERMQNLLLECEPNAAVFPSARFTVSFECANQAVEVFGCHICDGLERGWLEILEPSVIENLAD